MNKGGKTYLNFKSVQLKQRINISGILFKSSEFTHGLVNFSWYQCHQKYYTGRDSDLAHNLISLPLFLVSADHLNRDDFPSSDLS